ncbi:hydroxysqualene dehydroxylase HpnE [Novosphingobium sp. KACC 22771]|uniref:hydroxysqualene dehydroxylase HpnE n=1 Tax=Novosphingobium sp. KACC 22771 TaxID=3025670 RepID=UPI002366DA6F|nr:hydroxysqualene dehydroxylase HpnE [Novosphingobium sp. KACC 22771]WDF72999.1 hydroxysqualene dehydroxylase HpnE [Novosphingobium sp. KACC 22771]
MAFVRAQVIGAGMAGLTAAVELTAAGLPVALSEAGPRAGGRCRSYFDPSLGLTIDNGNHLVLAGNPAVSRFRAMVGADAPLAGPPHADFAFADLATGERWTLRINDGPVPWWVLVPSRRVPGSRLADYLPLGRLLKGRADQTIGDLVKPQGPVWERMLHPVLLAALNTDPAASSAALCANVLAETLAKGGRASAPRVAVPTLAAAFIDPAVDWLEAQGVALQTGRRLRGIRFEGDSVSALEWADGAQAIGADEAVVLAVPAWVAASLVPDLTVPDDHRSILNAHFACAPPAGAPEMLGLTHATSEWIFTHPDRISVTISGADRLMDEDREALATLIWAEVAQALGITAPMPRWQIVKEKRATFAATPEQDARRPHTETRWRNLFLAGDWVQNGLPATIEGAIRSGDSAARLVLGQPLKYGKGR